MPSLQAKHMVMTYIDMPHTLADIIGSRTRAHFGCITTNDTAPLKLISFVNMQADWLGTDLVHLEIPYGFRE